MAPGCLSPRTPHKCGKQSHSVLVKRAKTSSLAVTALPIMIRNLSNYNQASRKSCLPGCSPQDADRESAPNNLQIEQQFLQSIIQERFVFKQTPSTRRVQRESFKSKIIRSLEGVFFGSQKVGSFSVEERVLEAISARSDSFANSVFEKWVREVLERSLRGVGFGGEEGADVRLSLGGKEDDGAIENGFMGSSLPQIIRLSFMD